jgi:hypothetical protein
MEKTKIAHFSLIIGVGLIVALPVIVYGFPFGSHDGKYHALWYTHFAEQLWGGDLYPRWLMGMNGGLGSPVFFYYPPLPFYITSLLKPLFAADSFGWQQLGVSASVALILSGICAYIWLERIADPTSALVGAILYMVMPYHVAIDLYIRGAFGEFWTFVWMPLILYFVNKVSAGHHSATVGLIFSYALLIMTHLPTTLIFSPIIIGYAFFTAGIHRKVKVIGLTSAALGLGAGLSAIYLLPALTTQHFVSMHKLQVGYYFYENWFLFTQKISGRSMAILSWLTINIVTLICCACIFICIRSSKKVIQEASFWIVTMTISIFMMTPLSNPAWQAIPTLQKIQFPWRFNTIVVVAAAAILVLGVYSMKRPFSRLTGVTLIIAIMLITNWGPIMARAAWMNALPSGLSKAKVDHINTRLEQHLDATEYLPTWASMRDKHTDLFLKGTSQSGENTDRVTIVEGIGSVTVSSWEPRVIVLQVSSTKGLLLNIQQFYYPNWIAHLNDDSYSLNVQPSKPKGLLSIYVPGGRHSVSLHFEQRAPERLGQIVSTISMIIALVLIIWLGISSRFRSIAMPYSCGF